MNQEFDNVLKNSLQQYVGEYKVGAPLLYQLEKLVTEYLQNCDAPEGYDWQLKVSVDKEDCTKVNVYCVPPIKIDLTQL